MNASTKEKNVPVSWAWSRPESSPSPDPGSQSGIHHTCGRPAEESKASYSACQAACGQAPPTASMSFLPSPQIHQNGPIPHSAKRIPWRRQSARPGWPHPCMGCQSMGCRPAVRELDRRAPRPQDDVSGTTNTCKSRRRDPNPSLAPSDPVRPRLRPSSIPA